MGRLILKLNIKIILLFLSLFFLGCGYFKGAITDIGSDSSQNNAQEPLKLQVSGSSQITEGNSLELTISLNRSSTLPVSFSYSTLSDTASANTDFYPLSGSVTIPPGQTTVILIIPTFTRSGFQGSRNFKFQVAGVSGAEAPTAPLSDFTILESAGLTSDDKQVYGEKIKTILMLKKEREVRFKS